MKKIICVCLSCLLLVSCSKESGYLSAVKDFSYMTPFEKTQEPVKITQTRVAVLLPLTGESQQLGDYFRNSILMAQLEKTSPNASQVLFYDTKGTAAGAVSAFKQAKMDEPDIILGPIFAHEVTAVSEINSSIPMISFTSDETVLNDNTFSIALLISEQVNRLVHFACAQGVTKFALIGPDNKTGELVQTAFENAKQICPALEVTKQSIYPVGGNLTTAVKKIAPPVPDLKNPDLTDEEKELLTNPTPEVLGFDALFIFEQGVQLGQLTSLLNYYDVRGDLVPFYGLATLRYNNNTELKDAYFADMPQEKLQLYRRNYFNAFGKEPLLIAGLGYDAFALINVLSHQQMLNLSILTNPDGFQGINGRFRLNENGTNDRLLEVFQIKSKNRFQKASLEPVLFDEKSTLF